MRCHKCDEFVAKKRWALGYKVCLPCGDEIAGRVTRGFTVAIPFNKGAYQFIYNPKELSTTNPKRTI